jgi:hypothetical protein
MSRSGYWDDFCLAHLLHGVCYRLIAHPVSVLPLLSVRVRLLISIICANKDMNSTSTGENERITNKERGSASMNALRSFKTLLDNSNKILLEHWIIYHTRWVIFAILFRKILTHVIFLQIMSWENYMRAWITKIKRKSILNLFFLVSCLYLNTQLAYNLRSMSSHRKGAGSFAQSTQGKV